jgi:hypothetical protein
MGQLRTANKRHNRAVSAAAQARKTAEVAPPAAKPAEAIS